MDRNLTPSELELILIQLSSSLDFFVRLYREGGRIGIPEETVVILRERGFPDWSEFYAPQSDIELLNFMMEMIGIEKPNLDNQDQSDAVSQLAGKIIEIEQADLDQDKIESRLRPRMVEFILRFIAMTNDLVCALYFGRKITDLVPQARTGDTKALFTILKVDRNILSTEWAIIRIREAQIKGDISFFEALGKAVANKPRRRLKQIKAALAMYLFWNVGLQDLTDSQIADLFAKTEIWAGVPIDDIGAITQFRNRLGLKK